MNYVGQHCNGWCETHLNGKECQCTYDREYERLCLENPGVVIPEVANGTQVKVS